MKKEIQVFHNLQFGEVRVTFNENSEPLFCVSDVCKALNYANSRDALARHVDAPDVAKCDIEVVTGKKSDGSNANQIVSMSFVNESGLYSLIFGSRLESARTFKRWVTSEVLPSIRKTGGYLVAKADDTPEMIMARAVIVAQATIEKQKKQIEEQTAKITEDAPKVLFYDSVTSSKTVCLVKELATILNQNGCKNIGQNRLYAWLRENGYLGNRGEYYNMPTQKAMDLGLFKVTKGTRVDQRDGSVITTKTTKVTTKGLAYFINKFLGDK